MIGADSFSGSYSEAREKFLGAVDAAGGRAKNFRHPFWAGRRDLPPTPFGRPFGLIPGSRFDFRHAWRRGLLSFRRSDRLVAPRGVKLLPADTGALMITPSILTVPHGRAG